MTKETGLQKAVTSAEEALAKVNKEKYPKTYEAREQALKSAKIALDQQIRAEKAEKANKPEPQKKEKETPTKPTGEADDPNKSGYSLQDIRALSDVHDDDIDEITSLAAAKGITIAEAKKLPYIQSYLQTRTEERKTAEAAKTGSGPGVSPKEPKGKDILKKVEEGGIGELPDNQEDMDKLVEERLKRRVEEGK